jgi:hypothetical protein
MGSNPISRIFHNQFRQKKLFVIRIQFKLIFTSGRTESTSIATVLLAPTPDINYIYSLLKTINLFFKKEYGGFRLNVRLYCMHDY